LRLDSEQESVVSEEGSVVVVAGPGSGKTRVLTEKGRREMVEGHSILCLCFTRAAAREMGSRVPGLPATTIHSFCYGCVGWDEKYSYQGLLYRFLREKDKPRFHTVLVDECQDLNPLELDVVLSLVGTELFAVGDPYQSIYGFQGALGHMVVSIFESFGCKREDLHNNYRSVPDMVEMLNGIYDRDLVSKGTKETGLTAILCRTNDDLFYISKHLKELGVPHRLRTSAEVGDTKEKDILGESNLRLSTCHCAKGLEFDKVILWDWKPMTDEDEEMRVYYVACSRASKAFVEVNRLEELDNEIGIAVKGRVGRGICI